MFISGDELVLVEGEAQAALHRPAAVPAVVDAAAEPLLPGVLVLADAAAGDPGGHVLGHVAPVVRPW